MSEKRDFKGVWIPGEIWLDRNLNGLEKLFIAEINDSAGISSIEYFANLFQISPRRCKNIINSLRKKGYVTYPGSEYE